MAKLSLKDVVTQFQSASATNSNYALIEQAIENTLSRDGTSPNSMAALLDMAGNDITNISTLYAQEAVVNGVTFAQSFADLAQAVLDAQAAQAAAEAAATDSQNSAVDSGTARDFASLWSSAPSGTLVNDGINPANYSSYHWALVSQAASAALVYKGLWDPSTLAYPVGPYNSGDLWVVDTNATFDTIDWKIGDWLIRNIDNTAWDRVENTSDWSTLQNVPANVANALNADGSNPMTGNLSIRSTTPQLFMRDAGGVRADFNVENSAGIARQSINFDLTNSQINLYHRNTSGAVDKQLNFKSNGNLQLSSSVAPIAPADLTTKEYVDLAVAGASQGPNLIDNPDFAVTQTGTSIVHTASNSIQIFDRWIGIKGVGGSGAFASLTADVASQNTTGIRNYLRITSTGVTTPDNRIWQILPGTRLAGKQVSIKFRTVADTAMTVNVQLRVYSDVTNFNSVDLVAQDMGVGGWKEHIFTGTVPDIPNFTLTDDARIMVVLQFSNITNTTFNIAEIDMRQDNYVPPFVYPDYNEELEKAKYYFERLQAEGAPNTNINFGITYTVVTTTSQMPISFKKKYKIPTIVTDAAANFTLYNSGGSTPLTSTIESTTYTSKSSSLILLGHATIGVAARAGTLENTAGQFPYIDIDARPT